jgi:hypothetical protein
MAAWAAKERLYQAKIAKGNTSVENIFLIKENLWCN